MTRTRPVYKTEQWYECSRCQTPCDVRHYSRSRYFGTLPLSECCQAPAVVRLAKGEE